MRLLALDSVSSQRSLGVFGAAGRRSEINGEQVAANSVLGDGMIIGVVDNQKASGQGIGVHRFDTGAFGQFCRHFAEVGKVAPPVRNPDAQPATKRVHDGARGKI